ncbi:MAG: ATP-binding protein [Rhodospirillales bacterium]|nr:ATP-binding protein [Rhodospirillales bacterium]
MSRTGKDLIVSLVAGAAIVAVFASFELVENLFELTREHEEWDLDEIIACIPALAIVATWFALRRWREGAELNRTLKRQAGELADALEKRRVMEEQLREGYKVAAMGTLGGGFAGELRRVLEPIDRLSKEGLDRATLVSKERTRLERISDAVQGGLTIVSRMLAFGDGGTRATESIVAADGMMESISLAVDALDTTLEVAFRADDEVSRIHVNRWELHEVASQIVANATEAMGSGGRIRVTVERTAIDTRAAEARGLTAGDFVRVRVQDDGPGIPPGLQSHVFEPFFTTKGAGDGKGLGLAIAYSLVRGWNGDLSVDSEPGEGATFEMLIPARDADGN